jgi:hypothetical protein
LAAIELDGIDHITPRRLSPFPALKVVIAGRFQDLRTQETVPTKHVTSAAIARKDLPASCNA